jgi:hypothetical protein
MKCRERLKDLICLVADKDCEQTIQALLTRYKALGIRQLAADIIKHPDHDSGCCLQGPVLLRQFQRRYDHGLVIFDRDGSGMEKQSREAIEETIEKELRKAGWGNRAAVVVIEPELESWIWSRSPLVEQVLGWAGRSPNLWHWLEEQRFLGPQSSKPEQPKEAMDEAIWTVCKPHSSSLFRSLAERVSVVNCVDPAFVKLKKVLQEWFSAPWDAH